MRLVDAVYARTEELLKEKCITMYKLCIEGGIPYSNVGDYEKQQNGYACYRIRHLSGI